MKCNTFGDRLYSMHIYIYIYHQHQHHRSFTPPLISVLIKLIFGPQILSISFAYLWLLHYAGPFYILANFSSCALIIRVLSIFSNYLIPLTPIFQFLMKKVAKGYFNSLDNKLIGWSNGIIRRSIHRKSTWSSQYLHFTSFTPIVYKRG